MSRGGWDGGNGIFNWEFPLVFSWNSAELSVGESRWLNTMHDHRSGRLRALVLVRPLWSRQLEAGSMASWREWGPYVGAKTMALGDPVSPLYLSC